jgi:hypothetical protein
MDITPSFLLAAIAALVTLVAWAVRVEARVMAHGERHTQTEEKLKDLKLETLRVIDEVRADMRYIRQRLDEIANDRHVNP